MFDYFGHILVSVVAENFSVLPHPVDMSLSHWVKGYNVISICWLGYIRSMHMTF